MGRFIKNRRLNYNMTRLIFGGMSKQEIVRVIPKETRRSFPDVIVRMVDNLGALADVLDPRDSNFVVHRFLEGDVVEMLGGITGVASVKINSGLRYNPVSDKDYAQIVYSHLSDLQRSDN